MKRAGFLVVAILFVLSLPAVGGTGRVIKVLPEFLDKQGRTSLSPSLYERDAYQAILRKDQSKRAGLRYYIQWKTKGALWQPLRLRLELRGVAEGNLPKELVIDEPLVNKRTKFTRWTEITLSKEQYQHLGEITAWRVTLWEGRQRIGEQRSFLW